MYQVINLHSKFFFIEENLILWQEGSLVVSSALKLRRCSKGEDVIPQNNDLSKKAVCTDKKKKSQSQSSEHGVRQSIYQKKTEKYSPVGLLCWRNGFGTISFYQNKQSWSQRSICDMGRVLKRNLRICKYKIECQDPFTRQKHSTWVSVEDITSATAEKEQQRKDCTRDKMKKKKTAKKQGICVPSHSSDCRFHCGRKTILKSSEIRDMRSHLIRKLMIIFSSQHFPITFCQLLYVDILCSYLISQPRSSHRVP